MQRSPKESRLAAGATGHNRPAPPSLARTSRRAPRQKGAIRQILLGSLALVAALLVLLVLAVLLAPRLVDTAEIRDELEEQVRVRTGREIRIAGDLDLSLLPRLALDASEVVLERGAEGGAPTDVAGRIGRARVRVALWPLLRREISVQGLSLEGVDADLRDSQQGLHYRVRDLSLDTGPLHLGREGPTAPVRLHLEGLLQDLEAGLGARVDLRTRAVLDLNGRVHELQDVELDLTPEPAGESDEDDTVAVLPTFVFTAPRLVARLREETVTVGSFTMEGAKLRLRGQLEATGIGSAPLVRGSVASDEFSPREVLEALGASVPAIADPKALDEARFEADFEARAGAAALENLTVSFDDSTVTGRVAASQLDRPRPQLRFRLSMDAIDMDRYAPAEPERESPRPKTADPEAPPAPSGSGQTPDEAPEDGPLTLPIIGLGDRNVQGRVDIGRLHTAGLNLDDMVIGVTARDGVTRFDPFTAELLGGSYAGTVEIDERGARPVLQLDQQIVDIPFAELAAALFDHDELSGTASGGFMGTGTGYTVADVLDGLDGALFLELDEGALEGTDLWYEIRSAVALVRGEPGPEENLGRTVFTRLGMTAEITDGLLRSEDLNLRMPFLNVDGGGDLNLATRIVDFGLQATIRDTPEVAADPLGAELAGTTVPLRLRGPVDKPELQLDVDNLLRGEATRRILERLLKD